MGYFPVRYVTNNQSVPSPSPAGALCWWLLSSRTTWQHDLENDGAMTSAILADLLEGRVLYMKRSSDSDDLHPCNGWQPLKICQLLVIFWCISSMPYYVTVTLKVLWIFGPNHSKTIAITKSCMYTWFFCHPQGGAPYLWVASKPTQPDW